LKRQPRFLLSLAAAIFVATLSSCAVLPSWMPGSPSHIPSSMSPGDVPGAIQHAEAALAKNDNAAALEWMRVASETQGLPTEQREHVQVLLEQAAGKRIDELSAPDANPADLADLVELGLPRQLAVSAGVRAARRLIDTGELFEAYKLLKRLDTKFPLHHERQQAGDMMCEAGLKMIQDGPGFLGFFTTRDEGQEALEYVILNAPWAVRCDDAYVALADRYEGDHEWELAIDRCQKLVLNHPASKHRVEIQARVPRLRLRSIKSPEYDRTAVIQAEIELKEWLQMFAGQELEPEVRLELADCQRRLSDNDMIVSHFYDKVGNAFGARLHATRAIEEARVSGDEERTAAAQKWLDGLPAAEDPEAQAPAQP
jgi:hypothetical protein